MAAFIFNLFLATTSKSFLGQGTYVNFMESIKCMD